jgi:hypothetical protein
MRSGQNTSHDVLNVFDRLLGCENGGTTALQQRAEFADFYRRTVSPPYVPLTRARTVATNVLEENMLMIGNVLEVRDAAGRPVMAMSTRAYDAFSPEQRAAILKHVHAIHHAPVDMLEHVGGGGVRCTLAEIFR